MPVFHIEEEINLRTWDDILNRRGYQSPVETRKIRFLRVAAVYSFKEQGARCGISDCQQAPKGANWLYQMLNVFRKTYPIDLLAALKKLATSRNDNAILVAIIETDADPSHLERVEQLQGLGIFAADIREELIDKILKPLLELEELAANPNANTSLPRYCRWADNLEEQFACAEHLVEEGRAFFDTENLQRLKSVPLSEVSTRFVQSVRWKGDSVITKRK